MQRILDMWKLDWEYEFIDLEGGYYLVRFHSQKDYDHVLNDGPWLVLGHYLTVTEWKPNFHPSQDKTSFILV